MNLSEQRPIRVIIADDQPVVRQNIISLLDKANDIEIIGEARDGLEAVWLTERLGPDVLVIDQGLPRLNGLQAAEQVRQRKLATRVVIISKQNDKTQQQEALRRGASGYVPKHLIPAELLFTIRMATQWRLNRKRATRIL